MRIEFHGKTESDIVKIKKHLENENKGVKLSPSDAARWAISEMAEIIKERERCK
jgi:hypothetical protein